ncbi:hypothetical protein SAY87_015259 [Trapa incisa]|uniref:Uncharacterized protein n=1 Tax=Trapa incisa TaxID=236973 RepID=A0AAN7JM60_9MYRT|nr:hypothetical protein SAY87_015259 [Trapa incisa]
MAGPDFGPEAKPAPDINPTSHQSFSSNLRSPPLPHHHSTYGDRHPDENFISFCPSCLLTIHQRYFILPQVLTTAATIKNIFRPPIVIVTPSSTELRCSKSFSTLKNEGNLVTSGSGVPTSTTFLLWTTRPKSRQRTRNSNALEDRVSKIVEKEVLELLELTMKDHVDLNLSPKKTYSGKELKSEEGDRQKLLV